MKRLIIIPLLFAAVGCGSQQAAHTTVKTVHVHDTASATDSISASACKQAMEQLIVMEGKTIDAASAALHFQYAKGTKLMHGVTHSIDVVKPLVDLCRGG